MVAVSEHSSRDVCRYSFYLVGVWVGDNRPSHLCYGVSGKCAH